MRSSEVDNVSPFARKTIRRKREVAETGMGQMKEHFNSQMWDNHVAGVGQTSCDHAPMHTVLELNFTLNETTIIDIANIVLH